jgi:hypothetical protein
MTSSSFLKTETRRPDANFKNKSVWRSFPPKFKYLIPFCPSLKTGQIWDLKCGIGNFKIFDSSFTLFRRRTLDNPRLVVGSTRRWKV